MAKTEEIAGKFLGKKVAGKDQYSPEFLVAVPRQENRTYLGLDEQHFPEGFDTWHAYEFTTSLNSGLPVSKVLKIVYPSSSECIVESKSLKLYLNSFAMTKLGNTAEEVLEKAKEVIKRDLTNLLKTDIQLEFLDSNSLRSELFKEYKNIVDLVKERNPEKDIVCPASEEGDGQHLLKVGLSSSLPEEHRFMFDSLRSACRITHQPDFGNAFIYYESRKHITEESLIQYLVSFRKTFHFHEECTEMIFKRLQDLLDRDDKLMVCCLYTRRGGIDICPVRYQNFTPEILQKTLGNPEVFARYIYNVKQ